MNYKWSLSYEFKSKFSLTLTETHLSIRPIPTLKPFKFWHYASLKSTGQ